jgi:transposase
MSRIQPSDRRKIQVLWRLGFTAHQISLRIPCSESTVYRWLNRGVSLRNAPHRPGQGRSPMITHTDLLLIDEMYKTHRYEGSRQLVAHVNKMLHTKMTDRTLRRYYHSLGWKWGRPKKIPHLTEHHKQKRVQWAKAHLDTNWREWFFTDEKIFRAGDTPYGEHYKPGEIHVYETDRWSGQIHVWGAIHFSRATVLEEMKGKITSDVYVPLL